MIIMKPMLKAGFGWTLGCILASVAVGIASSIVNTAICRKAAHSKDFMTWVEKTDPKMFEQLKKYI
jgi:F0F1-type ATP synthase membrane subunit c/vacuolar-type H+-ATPase subunit K